MSDAISFKSMTIKSAKRLGSALAGIDPWAHYRYTPERLISYFSAAEADAPRFEILFGHTLAGAICVRRNWLRGPYLQLLAVLPEFQKRGIGGAALSWFEAEAVNVRAQNIWVAASEFNVRALAFYERFGFVRVATLEGLVSAGTAEILLRKQLLVA